MADIRETVLLDHMDTSRFRKSPTTALRSKLKLAVRSFVVATSDTPLRRFYFAIYKAHVSHAVRVLKKLPGIHSIYITGGMAIDEVKPGISDIDLTVNGVWTEEEEVRVIRALKRLGEQSPLYDTLISQCTQSLETLQSLYATDFYFQYLFDRGRTRWKLLHGNDIFSMLPNVPETRVGGGYYMELRTWWCYFIKSAFSSGPTATDKLFQTSIPYKATAGILMTKAYFDGEPSGQSRRTMMGLAVNRASGADRDLLQDLMASEKTHHQNFEGDIRQETYEFLMRQLEAVHATLAGNASFQGIETQGLHVDGSAAEMIVSSSAREYVDAVVAKVKAEWKGYLSASLVPCLSFFCLDDLVLLLEVRADELPTVSQIRDLCGFALEHASKLNQRVALYLLLPEAAYQLEIISVVELWHHTLCREANPEIFAFVQRPEFVLDGAPRSESRPLTWTPFASALVDEEIGIRRKAIGKIAEATDLASIELIRNLWRHLQLEIVQRSTQRGFVVLPMTVSSIQRMLQHFGIPAGAILDKFHEAYVSELNGQESNARALLPELMELFATFSSDSHVQV